MQGQRRLTIEQAQDARGLWDNGLASQAYLARRLQVGVGTIQNLVGRLTYQDIPDESDWLERAAERGFVLGIQVLSRDILHTIRQALADGFDRESILYALMRDTGIELTHEALQRIAQKIAYTKVV